jgi:hypothetical protein
MAQWRDWAPDLKRLPADEMSRWVFQWLFTVFFGTGSLMGLFTWIFGPAHGLTGVGWLLVFVGFALALIVCWAGIEHIRLIRQREQETSRVAAPNTPPQSASKQPAAGPALENGLYVADILLDPNKLAKGYLEVVIRCFNGSGYPATISRVRGAILYRLVANGTEGLKGTLGQPFLIPDRGGVEDIAHGSELFLVLGMWVNESNLSANIETHLRDGHTLSLDLKQLTIWCTIGGDDRKARLPLWSDITCHYGSDRLLIGRIVEAAMHIKFSS